MKRKEKIELTLGAAIALMSLEDVADAEDYGIADLPKAREELKKLFISSASVYVSDYITDGNMVEAAAVLANGATKMLSIAEKYSSIKNDAKSETGVTGLKKEKHKPAAVFTYEDMVSEFGKEIADKIAAKAKG